MYDQLLSSQFDSVIQAVYKALNFPKLRRECGWRLESDRVIKLSSCNNDLLPIAVEYGANK